MKNFYLIIIVLAFSTALLAGCGSPKSSVHESSEFAEEFRDAPAWVLDSSSAVKDSIAAVGAAKIGKGGVDFARTEASSLARNELARIIGVQVKDMVKNFSNQISTGDDQMFDKLASQTSQQVSRQTLTGSGQKALWISPDSVLHVLVAIDTKLVNNYVKESIKAGIRNQGALRQQFQNSDSFEELYKEVDRQF